MYLDEKIKSLREKAGLSFKEAAIKLDITEGTLEALETGFKDPDKIEMRKIIDLYNITEAELADDDPYVNAFSVLFEGADQQSNPLTGTLAFAAGLVGMQAMKADNNSEDTLFDIRKIPLIQNARLTEKKFIYNNVDTYIAACHLPSGEYIALYVTDNNLESIGIKQGDLAIVRVQIDIDCKDGDIVLLLQNSMLHLQQINKKERPPTDAPISTLGKVIETRKYFK